MKTNSKLISTLTGLIVALTIFLSACSPATAPAPTTDVNAVSTQAAMTVVAGLTQTAEAMPSPTMVPTATISFTSTPDVAATATIAPTMPPVATLPGSSPSPVPVNPATAFGCYNAAYMADVTILYAPAFNPGDKFTKTWRVKNSGSCDWPRGFQIMFVGGDRFGADTTTINQKVKAGDAVEISIPMTAPYLSGVVNSNWQLATDIGKPFGQVLSAVITLPESVAASGGCLNAVLISDDTIPSGTVLSPGEKFTKTWTIKNTGTCTWTGSFKITYVGSDLLGSDTTKIRQNVGPGYNGQISLDMTAPSTAGTYSSAWQLASDEGKLFGQIFSFTIIVK